MEEEFEEVAKFFKADEWKETSSSDKQRYQVMFNSYKDMIASGFDAPKPYFMNNELEDNSEMDEDADMETTFKRKCVVDSDMRKRTKLEETSAINSEEQETAAIDERNIPAEIPEDRYVYCDECMHEHLDLCKDHILIQVLDISVPADKNNSDRARDTLPYGLFDLKESNDSCYGVWAVRKIPKGLRFGPYEGVTSVERTDGRYCWQIKQNGGVNHYMDGFDTSRSNWMRYVHRARNKQEQNLMAYQHCGQIFYRTLGDIQPGTELLVFYGSKFPTDLGTDNSPYAEKDVFKCDHCYLIFCGATFLEEHVARCRQKYVALENSNASAICDDRSYPCPHCSITCTTRAFYNRHMESEHDDTVSRSHLRPTYECSVCKERFTTTGSLRWHERRLHTTEETAYVCDLCKRGFSRPCQLERHACLGQPYGCTECNKHITDKSHLFSHERVHHTGVITHDCTMCKTRFTVHNRRCECPTCQYAAQQNASANNNV